MECFVHYFFLLRTNSSWIHRSTNTKLRINKRIHFCAFFCVIYKLNKTASLLHTFTPVSIDRERDREHVRASNINSQHMYIHGTHIHPNIVCIASKQLSLLFVCRAAIHLPHEHSFFHVSWTCTWIYQYQSRRLFVICRSFFFSHVLNFLFWCCCCCCCFVFVHQFVFCLQCHHQ